MKDLFIKKIAYILSYMLCALLMEFISFNVMGLGVLPEYFWFDFAALMIIAFIIYIIPSFVLQSIIIIAMLIIQTIVSMVNEYLNKYSGNIFSLDMIGLGKEAANAFNASFMNVPLLIGLVLILTAEIVFLILLRKQRVKHTFKLRCVSTLVIVFILMQLSAVSVYSFTVKSFSASTDENNYILSSNSYLYDTFYIKRKAYKKFGSFPFYIKQVDNLVSKNKTETTEEIEKEKAENLSILDSYFSNGQYSSYNDGITGIVSDNNLIVVVMESAEWYGINQKFTPTLYALSNQGVSATNYYSRNKTNHSEDLGIIGSYPTQSVFTKNLLYKNDLLGNNFSFTLPNILKQDGYTTSYFHNNFGVFYERDTINQVLGFDNCYFLEDMPGLKGSGLMEGYPEKENFEDMDKDSLMFSTNLDKIAPISDSPFYSLIMTLTMHGGYDDLIKYGNYPYTDPTETILMTKQEKTEFSENCSVKGLEEYYSEIKKKRF